MVRRNVKLDLVTFESVEEFLSTEILPQGQFVVWHNGFPIDFEYHDRGYPTTAVFFHAAIGPTIVNLPLFLGKGFSDKSPVNRLFVSDPTLYVDERLRLAWYAGSSEQPGLQDALSAIFHKIAGSRRVLYSGASGGGFAALLYSAKHSGSLAMPVNPQTIIRNYPAPLVCEWTNFAWGLNNERSRDIVMPPVVTELLSLYSKPRKNHVIYIQNTGDSSHMEKHWIPFKEALHPENSLTPMLAFAGNGHVAPPNTYLASLLLVASQSESWAEVDFSEVSESPLRVR